jgi:hypothetical protein
VPRWIGIGPGRIRPRRSGALARAGELDGRWASSKDKESRPSGEERGDGAGRLREFRSQKVWSKTKGFLILV